MAAASRKQCAIVCAALVLGSLIIASCTTGPKPPQPGTPAFYWAAAKEMYRTGDYIKTADNLAQITKSDNDFTAQARIWEVIMAAGVAQANMELADVYEQGARANRNNPTPFRRQVSVLRGMASNSTLQFADAYHKFQDATKDETITLDFDFPSGNAAQPPELKRVSSGIVIPEAELAALQRTMTHRGVLLATCRAVGAPDDPAKAQELFKGGKPQVRRNAFRIHMAGLLHEQAQLFGPTKLDQPQRIKMLYKEAVEAIESMPPDKQTKELMGKIQGTLKKQKLSLK